MKKLAFIACALGIANLAAGALPNHWRMVTWPPPVVASYLVDYTQGTGAVTNPRLFTPLTDGRVMGIDYDGAGTLFAATTFNNDQVYKVIEPTGALIPWATLPAGGGEGDLAYNPANGMLYAISGLFGTTRVFEINPNIPNSVTQIMSLTGFDDVSGIAFDSLGNGYAVDTHFNSGGIAELLGVTLGATPTMSSLGSLSMNPGVTLGLDFDDADVLHMIVNNNGGLWTINPIGPSANFVESVAINAPSNLYAGLAWVPEPIVAPFVCAGGLLVAQQRRRR